MENAHLKHGKGLIQHKVSYFHDNRFQVDHDWSSFTKLKEKRGLKERQPGPEGYHDGAICVSASCYHLHRNPL